MSAASAERAVLKCNIARANFDAWVQFNKRASTRGAWTCGTPVISARQQVDVDCLGRDQAKIKKLVF